MAVEIRPLPPVFVGEVMGADLREPLSPEEVTVIDDGMTKFAVLVFPGQDITDDQQIAFSKQSCPLENCYICTNLSAYSYS